MDDRQTTIKLLMNKRETQTETETIVAVVNMTREGTTMAAVDMVIIIITDDTTTTAITDVTTKVGSIGMENDK